MGKEPTTSPRPPVLLQGATSADTNTMSRGLSVCGCTGSSDLPSLRLSCPPPLCTHPRQLVGHFAPNRNEQPVQGGLVLYFLRLCPVHHAASFAACLRVGTDRRKLCTPLSHISIHLVALTLLLKKRLVASFGTSPASRALALAFSVLKASGWGLSTAGLSKFGLSAMNLSSEGSPAALLSAVSAAASLMS